MADAVKLVDRCCAKAERAERELLQSRPRPGSLVIFAGGLPLRSLPPSLFPSKCPPPFTQFQVFSTFLLTYALRAFLLSSLRVPRFPRRRCPNFATAGTVAAGNDFALLGCITASRCCWQVCTVSIEKHSIARTPSTAAVAYSRLGGPRNVACKNLAARADNAADNDLRN